MTSEINYGSLFSLVCLLFLTIVFLLQMCRKEPAYWVTVWSLWLYTAIDMVTQYAGN